jgi:uncharacterized protein YaeQ
MALKSTIFKANLAVADIDHAYYADHQLTLARHPSENDERMMVRLAALALSAHELQTTCGGDGTLSFGAGLSNPDEPDVWLRDYTQRTRLWIEVGQPEEKPLVRACSKADKVQVFCFNHASEIWWKSLENKVSRLERLEVYRIPTVASQEMALMAERSMQIQATIQEGSLMLSDSRRTVELTCERWK